MFVSQYIEFIRLSWYFCCCCCCFYEFFIVRAVQYCSVCSLLSCIQWRERMDLTSHCDTASKLAPLWESSLLYQCKQECEYFQKQCGTTNIKKQLFHISTNHIDDDRRFHAGFVPHFFPEMQASFHYHSLSSFLLVSSWGLYCSYL